MLGASAAALTHAATPIGTGVTTQLRADPDQTRKNNLAQAIIFGSGNNPFNKGKQPPQPPVNPPDIFSGKTTENTQ